MGKNLRVLFFFPLISFFLLSIPAKSQLLWKVSNSRSGKTSFLFAGVNSSDERVISLTQKALPFLRKAEVTAFELIPNADLQPLMMNHIFFSGDSSLKDMLPPEQFTELQRQLGRQLGQILPFADRIKPVFLSMLLQESANLPTGKKSAYDLIYDMSSAYNMKVFGLTEFEDLMERMNYLPMDWQLRELADLLAVDHRLESEKMIQLYLAENVRSIEKEVSKSFSPKKIYIKMVEEPQKRIAGRLLGLLHTNSVFAVIAASSFTGKSGVIHLLKKEGFEVTPILLFSD